MKQIIRANDAIMRILRKGKTSNSGYRMIKYCIALEVEDGVLLFNLLTRQLLLLSPEEYAARFESEFLRDNWFVVPEDLNEKEHVNLVRWVSTTMHKKPEHITNYTILTTTDCNARCFYCYELGRSRIPMSEETARETAAYIKNNCGGKKVRITWFGGEPLYNFQVINVICDELRAGGVDFETKMISNSYLFDQDMVERATNSWALKMVQISLDGTEEIYNRSKAFIYKDGSAYRVVLNNISRLLDAGIRVSIRLNMDLNNADDLMALVDELAVRFAGKKDFSVYTHPIYDENVPQDKLYTSDKLVQMYDKLHQLQDHIYNRGLASPKELELNRGLKMNHCMADSGNSVVVVPDGRLGLCEHHSENEFIGHVNSNDLDKAVIESWQEHCQELPECDDCLYYPCCIKLKKCINAIPCSEHTRKSSRRLTERAMLEEYKNWRKKAADNDDI